LDQEALSSSTFLGELLIMTDTRDDVCCVCKGDKCNDPYWYHGENDLAWVYVFECEHSVHTECAQSQTYQSDRLKCCPLCRQQINWENVKEGRHETFNDVDSCDDDGEPEKKYEPEVKCFYDPASRREWWWIDDCSGENHYGSYGWCLCFYDPVSTREWWLVDNGYGRDNYGSWGWC
jgi:hypothetical protein